MPSPVAMSYDPTALSTGCLESAVDAAAMRANADPASIAGSRCREIRTTRGAPTAMTRRSKAARSVQNGALNAGEKPTRRRKATPAPKSSSGGRVVVEATPGPYRYGHHGLAHPTSLQNGSNGADQWCMGE